MIKTILIDDDFLVLQALETILSVQDHIEVVGTGNDGRDAVELYITHQPDLVLMDIRMEPTSGIEAAQEILKDLDKKSYNEIDLFNKLRLIRAIEVCYLTNGKFSELRMKNIKSNNYKFLKITYEYSYH